MISMKMYLCNNIQVKKWGNPQVESKVLEFAHKKKKNHTPSTNVSNDDVNHIIDKPK